LPYVGHVHKAKKMFGLFAQVAPLRTTTKRQQQHVAPWSCTRQHVCAGSVAGTATLGSPMYSLECGPWALHPMPHNGGQAQRRGVIKEAKILNKGSSGAYEKEEWIEISENLVAGFSTAKNDS
jgi:hypothetical protein